jgi:sugar (pentulose or hexulose) kinase
MVVAGGGDQQCAALGVGVNTPGRIKCTTGTGSFILGYLKEPNFDPDRRVLCSCHAIPGAWVQEASIFTTGSVLRWVRDIICSDEIKEAKEKDTDPYDLMIKLAENTPVGANGLIIVPHMMGAGAPHWNPDARGIIFGLTLGHTKADIIRAVLEGVAFEIKKNLELFEELGNEITEMRITGGGSRSEFWNQIMADILNVTLSRGEMEESTAVGAMILAAYGVGDYKSIVDASNKLARISKSWTPDPKVLLSYNQIYALSKDIYEALEFQDLYKRLEL